MATLAWPPTLIPRSMATYAVTADGLTMTWSQGETAVTACVR